MVQGDASSPGGEGANITPSDTATIIPSRGLYCGSAGTLRVRMVESGATVDFAGVVAGTILPVRADKVFASGTSVTGIVALW